MRYFIKQKIRPKIIITSILNMHNNVIAGKEQLHVQMLYIFDINKELNNSVIENFQKTRYKKSIYAELYNKIIKNNKQYWNIENSYHE